MNKAKQLIIALLSGMKPDHIMLKDIVWDRTMGQDLLTAASINKSDLLSTAVNGRSFFEYKETWENFPFLQRMLKDNGESFDNEEFTRSLKDGKSMIKMAEENGALNLAFAPEIWAGHSESMETVWFAIDKATRDKYDFIGLRRAIAQAEGVELREDQLKKAGITPDEMRTAIRDGKLETVKRKLAAVNDHLQLADLYILDATGDIALDGYTAWTNAANVFAELASNGVQLEPKDFLYQRAGRRSILASALHFNSGFKHIFTSKVWGGRVDDMLALMKHVPADKQKDIDMGKLFQDIYSSLYAPLIKPDDISAQDLITPINPDAAFIALPLGIKETWDAMDKIQAHLKQSGQKLTLHHLRQTSGYHGETCLVQAVRFGHLNKVMQIMAENNERFSYDDLTAKASGQTETLLSLICKGQQHKALMQPEYWTGRGQEMLRVYEAMLEAARKDIDFASLYNDINRRALLQRHFQR